MKQKEKPIIDVTSLVHKLEFATMCTQVYGDEDTVNLIKKLIVKIKNDFYFNEEVDNPFVNIEIQPEKALIKADVWYKMAFIDFESKTGLWLPKKYDECKNIRYIVV